MFLKNRNISSKIKRSKVTEYAALTICVNMVEGITRNIFGVEPTICAVLEKKILVEGSMR